MAGPGLGPGPGPGLRPGPGPCPGLAPGPGPCPDFGPGPGASPGPGHCMYIWSVMVNLALWFFFKLTIAECIFVCLQRQNQQWEIS